MNRRPSSSLPALVEHGGHLSFLASSAEIADDLCGGLLAHVGSAFHGPLSCHARVFAAEVQAANTDAFPYRDEGALADGVGSGADADEWSLVPVGTGAASI